MTWWMQMLMIIEVLELRHLKSITEPWNILNGPKAVVAEASAEQAKEVAGRIHPEKDSTLSFVAE